MVFFKCLPNQLFVGRKDKENVDFGFQVKILMVRSLLFSDDTS